MKKWGVRLIGFYFLIRAVSEVYQLITGTRHAKGFFGIYLRSNNNSIDAIDIMAWIGVYILIYTGIQLIRFDRRGRTWALILFWPSVIFMGTLFMVSLISFFYPSIYEDLHIPIAPTLSLFKRKAETPFEIFLFLGFGFSYCLIPLYYLLRKDTKALFQKVPAAEANV